VCALCGVGKHISIRPQVATKSRLNSVLYNIPPEEGKKNSLLTYYLHSSAFPNPEMKTTATMNSKKNYGFSLTEVTAAPISIFYLQNCIQHDLE
jgi:hypothetical protein